MLQFLQTGKVLYILAAVCGLGAISKLVTSSLYKRLVKETGNMALTKNKNLRSFKQKTESMFLLSHGIRNTNAYIEKQIYGFRFIKMSLDTWDNLSVQAMILCFLIGGIAAFGAYWYRCDSYYIVLYGTMGILTGLFLVLVDNGANISLKRQQLTDSLIDYVENSPHFYKTMGKSQESGEMEKRLAGTASAQKARLRGLGRNERNLTEKSAIKESGNREIAAANGETTTAGREVAAAEEDGMSAIVHIEKAGSEKDVQVSGRKHGGKRFSVLSRKKGRREPLVKQAEKPFEGRSMEAEGPGDGATRKNVSAGRAQVTARTDEAFAQEDDELAKSIDYLKQSLEQIAASREQARRELQVVKSPENANLERARKELSAEDLKFLGELLQEYLT